MYECKNCLKCLFFNSESITPKIYAICEISQEEVDDIIGCTCLKPISSLKESNKYKEIYWRDCKYFVDKFNYEKLKLKVRNKKLKKLGYKPIKNRRLNYEKY